MKHAFTGHAPDWMDALDKSSLRARLIIVDRQRGPASHYPVFPESILASKTKINFDPVPSSNASTGTILHLERCQQTNGNRTKDYKVDTEGVDHFQLQFDCDDDYILNRNHRDHSR